jgi:hypothetical protein
MGFSRWDTPDVEKERKMVLDEDITKYRRFLIR